MTKKRTTGLAIGLAAACIAVPCVAGASNKITKEEKAVLPAATTSTTAITTTVPPITTAPVTTSVETSLVTTTVPQITTAVTCSTAEQGLYEMPTTTTTAEQTAAADTTVQLTTTDAPAATTAPAPVEPYNGQTSGDYIYCIGFGWVFNEGGGGYGETNYDMYCNGNKIGYFV
ncbi:MAG: hypothetical protein IJ784_13115 [Ruminiclostridium sp.]|nr:hypothetical protein [Ruminiclostridium sp.]